ncbi:FtsX-like permease family protein [Eubacterium aggregans]|uniref:ABC transporter permease n=1 Tax=Eubacterium aggregans TaxID=81409 RepID=UPI003F402E12
MAQYESLKANEKQLTDGLGILAKTLEGLNAQLKTLTPGTSEYIQLESLITALSELQKTLAAQLADVQKAIKALDAGTVALKQLEASRAQLDAGWAAYNQGVAQLEEGRQSGAVTMEAGETALAQGKQQLAQGKAELETKRAEGEQQLADAQIKIDDAQKQLDDLTLGKWYVFNRNDNPGYTSYGEDAKRIDNLANVFPPFFLLVSVLISFTTMTRMVEEQHLEIGTLKGLGYSRSQIAFKYVIYAATAAGIGSVVGAIFGVNVLPRLIVSAYSLLYQVPDLIIDIPWGMVIASILGGPLPLPLEPRSW